MFERNSKSTQQKEDLILFYMEQRFNHNAKKAQIKAMDLRLEMNSVRELFLVLNGLIQKALRTLYRQRFHVADAKAAWNKAKQQLRDKVGDNTELAAKTAEAKANFEMCKEHMKKTLEENNILPTFALDKLVAQLKKDEARLQKEGSMASGLFDRLKQCLGLRPKDLKPTLVYYLIKHALLAAAVKANIDVTLTTRSKRF